jgi:hypothetical protein
MASLLSDAQIAKRRWPQRERETMPDLVAHGHLIVKLYELRREPELRAARVWYATAFHPHSAEEVATLMRSGFAESAKYRMVTTYWEMAAALVNHGALDEPLFHAANTEHIAVFAKLEPFLGELRQLFREPTYLQELEQLVSRAPGGPALLEKRRRLLRLWHEQLMSRASASEASLGSA